MELTEFQPKYFKVEIRDDGWVELTDLGRLTNLKEWRAAYQDFKAVEKLITEKNLKGWIAGTLPENSRVIKIFDFLGAIEYRIFNGDILFFKETKNAQKIQKNNTSAGSDTGSCTSSSG